MTERPVPQVAVDIAAIPFSRFGSYTAFSELGGRSCMDRGIEAGVWMRCVHGDVAAYEAMRFELVVRGRAVPHETHCSASCLTLRCADGHVDICIPEPDTVRVRAVGVTLRVTARCHRNHGAVPEPQGTWVFNMAASLFRSYRLVPLAGVLSVDAPWVVKRCEHMVAELVGGNGDVAEMAIETFTAVRPMKHHAASFDTLTGSVQAEFEAFATPFLARCAADLREIVAAAAYLDWSSVVEPNRLLQRPAMYMSKNHMTNVWAWDHAFNALAVSLTDPDLAWDQFMVMFDHQDQNGQIPDFINDVRYLNTFVKPPIHGWILLRMVEACGGLCNARLQEAYARISAWTDWWFAYRDPDQDGLPVYWHGNDSGWDNGTVFDLTFPAKSPDLAAFLVLQMDALAALAEKLGRHDEAATWRIRAERTCEALVTTLWAGTRFCCVSTVTRQAADPSDSCFGCLPIILGKRLPEKIRSALVREIRRHLTPWGLATEHPGSPMYEPDGYWRGPIWAPPTLIIIDGLLAAGEQELAATIAERFVRLCATSGFAENFDALTGEPLRDRGYTWTSSVFLVLACCMYTQRMIEPGTSGNMARADRRAASA